MCGLTFILRGHISRPATTHTNNESRSSDRHRRLHVAGKAASNEITQTGVTHHDCRGRVHLDVSPDTRHHRGAHPADQKLFNSDQLPILRRAVAELSWLLSRGYNVNSSLKLVGDRHGLRERQRLAVSRSACSNTDIQRRKEHCLSVARLRNQNVIVDGFNLIITLEAALSNGPLLIGVDRCVRDLSSVHGSYRSVEETDRALIMVGKALQDLGSSSVVWLLDRPVSNSGRLASRIGELANTHGWPWKVETVFNPDARIMSSPDVAITSDSLILNQVQRWADLKSHLLSKEIPDAWLIDLSSERERSDCIV